MKLLAVWKGWLDGCIAGSLFCVGAAHAVTPPDVVINTDEEALAFKDAAPFVFEGQALQVHRSFSTDRSMELHWDAPITVGADTQFEIRGALSTAVPGARTQVEKRGLGRLTLRGDSRHTGNTVLREGELVIGHDHALGASSNNLDQMAGTRLELENGVRLPQHVVLKAADATTNALPGVVDGVEWRVQSGQAQLLHQVNAQTAMRKVGAGDLRLSQAYLGVAPIQVHQGGLIIERSVSAPVIIDAGARLESTSSRVGVVSRATVGAHGMIAPGGRDAVGTLAVVNDIEFEPDGIFHVNAYDDGRADQIQVAGAAQLDGLVQVDAGAGDWANEETYTILSATRGLNDTTFDHVTANLAFLTPSLSYTDNAVLLSLQRNDAGAGDVADPGDKDVGDIIDPPVDALDPPADEPPPRPRPRPPRPPEPVLPPSDEPGTENPRAENPAPDDPSGEDPEDRNIDGPGAETPISDGPTEAPPELDPPPSQDADADAPAHSDSARPLTPLQRAIVGMSPGQAKEALKQFGGSWHASMRSFLMEDSRYVREAVLAANSRSHSDGPSAWGQVFGAAGKRASAHGIAGDRHHTHGMVLGIDVPSAAHWRVGGVVAAQQAKLKRDGSAASASVDSLHVGMSARRQWDAWRLTTGLLHAWHRLDSTRRVTAGPLKDVLKASYTARSLQVFMELAPRLRAFGDWAERYREGWGPYLQQAWIQVKAPGFEEVGGAAAHRVDGATLASHVSTLGWRLGTEGNWRGRPIRLGADLAWRHAWKGTRVASVQRFRSLAGIPGEGTAGESRAFESRGLSLSRNGAALGVQASIQLHKHATLATRYSGLYGRGYRDHAGWVEFRWAF